MTKEARNTSPNETPPKGYSCRVVRYLVFVISLTYTPLWVGKRSIPRSLGPWDRPVSLYKKTNESDASSVAGKQV